MMKKSPSKYYSVKSILWFSLGVTLLFLALALLVTLFFVELHEFWPIFIFFYLMLIGGMWLMKRGVRVSLPEPDDLLEQDNRQPVIYLRPFEDDNAKEENWFQLIMQDVGALIMPTVEEKLVMELASVGPVVAIGKPDEVLAPSGAGRIYCTEDTWQDVISEYIDRSRLIVIRAGFTDGVLWELEELGRLGRRENIIVHVPFKRSLFGLSKAAKYEKFRHLFNNKMVTELPERLGDTLFFHFNLEGDLEAAATHGFGPFFKVRRTLRHLLKQKLGDKTSRTRSGHKGFRRLILLSKGIYMFFLLVSIIAWTSCVLFLDEKLDRDLWRSKRQSQLYSGWDVGSYRNDTIRHQLRSWVQGLGELQPTRDKNGPLYKISEAYEGPSSVQNYGINYSFKYGFVERNGAIAVAPRFSDSGSFSEGVVPIELKNGQWAYMDGSAEHSKVLEVNKARHFSEGRAAFQKDSYPGLWGYFDRNFNEVIPPEFSEAKDFSEGFAAVEKDGDWRFIDPEGNFIDEKSYYRVFSFSDGLAMVVEDVDDDYKNRYIGTNGNLVIDGSFNAACSFVDGLALAKERGLWGFIDKTGKFVVEPRFQYGADFQDLGWSQDLTFSDGLLMVEIEGRWGFVNGRGEIVVEPVYSQVKPFSEGLAAVQAEDGLWGYIDTSGKLKISARFKTAYAFNNGLGKISIDTGKRIWPSGYVDAEGVLVVKPL